jgi:hypothetical protein
MRKAAFSILFISFIFSIINSISYINKFDKNFFQNNNTNISINGIIGNSDGLQFFNTSDKIIKAIVDSNSKYPDDGPEYINSFLYPRIIAVWRIIFNNKDLNYFFSDNENITNTQENLFRKDSKLHFFIFQKLIYLLSIYFFYLTLLKIFTKKNANSHEEVNYIPILTLTFLSFEPTINQFHQSFFTESIYFTLLIILFDILIRAYNKITYSKIYIIFAGLILGLSYAQRTISFFLIFLIYFFFLLLYKKKIIQIFVNLLILFLCVIAIISYDNYQRTSNFFYTPSQSKCDITFYYVIPNFYQKKYNTNYDKATEIFANRYNVNIKNLENLTEMQKRNLCSNLIEPSINEIFINFNENFKIFFKNIFRTMTINPYFINNAYLFYSNNNNDINYNPGNTHLSQIKARATYSFFLYFLFVLGLYKSVNLINYKIRLLVISIFFYFLFFSNTIYPSNRYFAPALIFMSIFVSISINTIIKKIKNYNI